MWRLKSLKEKILMREAKSYIYANSYMKCYIVHHIVSYNEYIYQQKALQLSGTNVLQWFHLNIVRVVLTVCFITKHKYAF